MTSPKLFGQATNGSSPDKSEIDLVLRISRELFEDLTRADVENTLPIDRTMEGIEVSGQATGRGRTHIEFAPSRKIASFEIVVTGTADGFFRADAGPATGHLSTDAQFVSRKQFRFDGARFDSDPANTSNCNVTRVDLICPRRGGIIGGVVKHVGRRMVVRNMSEINRTVQIETGKILSATFDESAESLVQKLNVVSEFEKTVAKYFPESTEWRYHLETTGDSIMAGAGPQDSSLPSLPAGENGSQIAPIEVWIRSSPWVSSILESVLIDWNVAHDALREFLPEDGAKKLAEDIRVVHRSGWTLIQVGVDKNPTKAEQGDASGHNSKEQHSTTDDD